MKFLCLVIVVVSLFSCKEPHKELPHDLIKERNDTIKVLIEKIPYAEDVYIDSFKILSVDSIVENWHLDRDVQILESSIKYIKDTLTPNQKAYGIDDAKIRLARNEKELRDLQILKEKSNDTSFYGYIVTVRYYLRHTESIKHYIETDSVIITKALKTTATLRSFNEMVKYKVWQ